jgi:ribosomal-protein-alanine N-acetyltransferase
MDCHTRWMIRRDMPDVLAIESQCFPGFAWTEGDFLRCLRQPNCIGNVAELGDEVAGYMIFELHKNRLHLLNFAVAKAYQRKGVGTCLIARLQRKLSYERRNRIMLEVRETNLAAQLFFRSLGFKAIQILRDFWEDSDEAAYLMQYRYEPTEADLQASYENKITFG